MDAIANECSLAFARSLKIPVVAYWGFSFHGGEVMYTSVFNPPSIIPGFFSGYPQRMNLWQRTANFVLNIGHRLFMMDQVTHIRSYFMTERFIRNLLYYRPRLLKNIFENSFRTKFLFPKWFTTLTYFW